MDRIVRSELHAILHRSADLPGVDRAIATLEASDASQFNVRMMAKADLLTIYQRRERMGQLTTIPGGSNLVSELEKVKESEVGMIVIETPEDVSSIWLDSELRVVIGTLTIST
ncbi:hypothetical protein GCM10022234_15710 [Aeromicrobium panaciterrae]|uniref:hypothetical protein n=1 Tax=Aeromicrobium panaciterrae TaxID=363861 RepID=UPI0031DB8A5F